MFQELHVFSSFQNKERADLLVRLLWVVVLREAGNVTAKIGDWFKNIVSFIYVRVNDHICTHKYIHYNAVSLLD